MGERTRGLEPAVRKGRAMRREPISPSAGVEGPVIRLAHGSGGETTGRLIRETILPRLGNPLLDRLGDSAVLALDGGARLAFTTDSYVIDPIFFPGGDIGYLSVCGTVNDLSMAGAEPRWISAGLILEEGFPLESLERILDSMARAAAEAGVQLVTGDTKVVAHGSADRIFINTAGIGIIPDGLELGPERCRPGDRVLVSGPVGSHGLAVLAARKSFRLETSLESDVAPLGAKAAALVRACPGLRMMRDPTRGGLAGVLSEISAGSGLAVELTEADVPVLDAVRGGCEILGFDPLFLANEGVLVAVVAPEDSAMAVKALRESGAEKAAVIGTLSKAQPRAVTVRTLVGGRRMLIPLGEELLPRIC